jgi:translation initiation factor IF-1
MSKEGDHVEFEGEVINCGKGGHFRIKVSDSHVVLARLSGKMRKNKIKVVLGDKVKINVSPYDPTRGFITLRVR